MDCNLQNLIQILDKIFGKKIVAFGGNIYQFPLVVPQSMWTSIVSTSLKLLVFWPIICFLKLSKNI